MRVGGIILCGGKSYRMGFAKAWLPFGSEVMLPRIVRLLSPIVSPLVVVAAADQRLPPCPSDVLIVKDEHPDRGPLEGLRAGLKALRSQADAAYVTSVDVPLLQAAFVRKMIAELGEADVAVPIELEGDKLFHHPLAGVYRTTVLPTVEALLATDQRRLAAIFASVNCHRVPVDALRSVDPQLASLRNLNRPEDYDLALREAGLPSVDLSHLAPPQSSAE